jgi:hypothetical protein
LSIYNVLTKRIAHSIITIFRYITYLPKGQHTPLSPFSGILRIYQKDNKPHYHHLPVYYVFTKRTTQPIITIFRYITYLPKGQHTPLPPSSGILRTYQKDNTPHYHHFPVYYVFTNRTTHPIITIFRYITYLPKGQHTPLSPFSDILRIYKKDNTLNWIFIVLIHRNNILRVDMVNNAPHGQIILVPSQPVFVHTP